MQFDKFMFQLVFWITWFCIKLAWYSLGYLAHNSFLFWAEQDSDRKGLGTSHNICWSVMELKTFDYFRNVYDNPRLNTLNIGNYVYKWLASVWYLFFIFCTLISIVMIETWREPDRRSTTAFLARELGWSVTEWYQSPGLGHTHLG